MSDLIIYNTPDGKKYNVTFYSLEMIMAIGFRVRGLRGTQFRQWGNRNLTKDAKEMLGDVANICRLFHEFQEHLYNQKVA
ncbi:MAG: virulence RhuM family protein [Prolixibacteraceae bacterium]|nr:virulence RhuM family protein [Prolixibacteraceae bacterium]